MEMATTTPSTNTDGQPSVIKSFVHRRQPSKGEALVPAPQSAEIQHVDNTRGPPAMDRQPRSATAQAGHGLALGEIQLNQQERGSSPLRREYQLQHQQQQQFDQQQHQQQTRGRSTSPTKSRSANPFRSRNQSRDPSPTKSTGRARGIAGFLSRPKSMVLGGSNSNNNGSSSNEGDKENVSPVEVHPPPIYAQFTSDASVRQANRSSVQIGAFGSASSYASDVRPTARERPKSYHASVAASQQQQPPSPTRPQYQQYQQQQQQQQDTPRRAAHHQRTRSAVPSSSNTAGPSLAPEDIDRHLEAMLDRRNIPENQRYKMRNLSDTIKMEFIRQDFAEMQAARAQAGTGTAAGSTGSANSANSAKGSSSGSNRNSRDEAVASSGPDAEPEKPRHTRGRSFTWGRSKKSSSSRSPSKKTSSRSRFMGEGTSLGRHFRTKSSESLVGGDRPTSSGSAVSGGDGGSAGGSGGSGHGGGFLSKLKMQQGPGDYVAYLARVRQPEQVEVGKLHKLRLLLRNETVAWIEEFMDRGGMTEIVGLLHRIMDVEWR